MTESRMEKIATDMLICRTLKEVAEKNGITERTLRRIRNTEDFHRILMEARSKAFEGVFDVVCAAAPESAMQLIEIMRDPKAPASARVSASRSIMDFAQGYYNQTEILDRISALEKHFERMTYEDEE